MARRSKASKTSVAKRPRPEHRPPRSGPTQRFSQALGFAVDPGFFCYLPFEAVPDAPAEADFLARLAAEAHAKPRSQYHLGIVWSAPITR
jgi:hypothetical protein